MFFAMKRVIAGATGFIGTALVQKWLSEGKDIIVIGRSQKKITAAFGRQVRAVTWDELTSGRVDGQEVEGAVNLAGAGIAEKRWTPQRKKEILDSRLLSTRRMSEFCLKNRVPLFNGSAVGIYGFQEAAPSFLPRKLDEDSPVSAEDGDHFLPAVCRQWEKAAQPLKAEGIRTVFLRTGVVLGRGGGALEKMAGPFRFFAGGPIGSGCQPVPWISLKDVCRAIDFVFERKDLCGPVNLVAPQCVRQKGLARALGRALHRPAVLPVPGFVLSLLFGQMAREVLLSGQHVSPKRLLEAGFEFQHDRVEQVLEEVYQV